MHLKEAATMYPLQPGGRRLSVANLLTFQERPDVGISCVCV